MVIDRPQQTTMGLTTDGPELAREGATKDLLVTMVCQTTFIAPTATNSKQAEIKLLNQIPCSVWKALLNPQRLIIESGSPRTTTAPEPKVAPCRCQTATEAGVGGTRHRQGDKIDPGASDERIMRTKAEHKQGERVRRPRAPEDRSRSIIMGLHNAIGGWSAAPSPSRIIQNRRILRQPIHTTDRRTDNTDTR
jgi:hypothetical protein